MVDLVKIRQKAREQKESRGDLVGEDTGTAPSKETAGTKGNKRGSSSTRKAKGSRGAKGTKKPKQAAVGSDSAKQTAVEASRPAEEHQIEPRPPEPAAPAATVAPGDGGESRLNRFKRTAGVMERQAADDEEVDVETSDGLLELITFTLAGEHYAIDVGQLVEIIVPRPSTRVPNASDEVIGIISLRGSIVTLLDLRRILGHAGKGEETEDTRIIVVQHENEKIGFIVDRVLRVVKVEPDSVEPHPVVSVAEQNEAVHGVFLSGDTITIYLDLDRIAG